MKSLTWKQRRLLNEITKTSQRIKEHKLMVTEGEKYLVWLKRNHEHAIKEIAEVLGIEVK